MMSLKKKVSISVAVVSVAVLCMMAYYGVCMLLLQNGIDLSDFHGLTGLAAAVCIISVLKACKKEDK